MLSFFNSRLAASIFVPTAMLAIAIPSRPASARNQFDVCASQLLRSGLSGEEAAIACAQALEPSQLSRCVLRIQDTTLSADAAVRACFRVRRPLELADCVVDINDDALEPYIRRLSNLNQPADVIEDAELEASTEVIEPIASLALDTCRRSLLPERHSECVVALSRDIPDQSPADAMETCINAESFPPELYPAVDPES